MNNNNYCVIMAGGIGSRFWPFSRKELPKQFLDFLGTGRTLLQQTYDRYSKVVEPDHIFVMTNTDYVTLVAEQLPEIDSTHILAEPARRNTAPCLAWATYHIHAIDSEAGIVFTPTDHLILKEEEFVRNIEEGLSYVHHNERLLCVGIRPTRVETRYGYIQVGEGGEGVFAPVKTFTEKPEAELAKLFVESGEFYWNGGIFMGKARTIIEAFHEHAPELAICFESSGGCALYGTEHEKDFIEKYFSACPNVSIEYGILEKTDNVTVMTCDFGWIDLGTWSTYHDSMPKDENNNVLAAPHTLDYDCHGCMIHSTDKKKLIVAQGLEDYLVVDTKDVLLICPKGDNSMLRKIINDAQVIMNGNEWS